MKIGTFSLNEQTNEIEGRIITRTLRFPLLILRRPEDRGSDRSPVFEIFEPNPAGELVGIGAVWERRTRQNDEVFLSGMIDDFSFPEPLPIALFGDELKGFDVQWRREREQQPAYGNPGYGAGGNGYGQRRSGQGQRQTMGGFAGGSTAGANGEYTGGMARSLDDEVPF